MLIGIKYALGFTVAWFVENGLSQKRDSCYMVVFFWVSQNKKAE